MAGKGRQSWEKRQRERAKRDKQMAKRAEREERKAASSDTEEETAEEGPSEAELYARFAKLSERHAAGEIDDETFEEKRAELFELLGLEIH